MRTTLPPALDDALVSPAFYQNPYPLYEQLRADLPVVWSERMGAWLLARYDDVIATLRDTEHFSSRGRLLAALDRLTPDERAQLQPFENHFTGGLINSDPPDHTRMRALINKAFSPRMVEQMRSRVAALVNEFLDVVQNQGSMDVIKDLAYPLPATVIAEMLGAPAADRDRFKVWSEAIFAIQGRGRLTFAQLAHAQEHLLQFRAYLRGLIAIRRQTPHDDLLGQLVAVEMAGDRLTEAELLTTCVTLLTAGHETTTNLIGSTLYTLLRHPETLQAVQENPALLPTAIEEVLRFESPLQRNPRRLAQDYEYGGQAMKKGDFVLQMLGSANRDPVIFPDADHFDIYRQPNRHVAFGFGLHFCLGAPLARLEAPIAVQLVLERMHRLQLATTTPNWMHHNLVRGLASLVVVF